MTKLRDRVKELRRVRASELVPNEANWRVHPEGQRRALGGLLDEIGWADALLAREDGDGRLVLVDGHLRRDLRPDDEVPVLVLDVTEAEAKKLLVSLDPLAGMALADEEKLNELLADVGKMDKVLLRELDRVPRSLDNSSDNEGGAEDTATQSAPEVFSVVVDCKTEDDQKTLFERMRKENRECRLLTL